MRTALAAAVVAVVAPAPAIAAEVRPFNPQAFAAAQRAGRPILVDIYADWCPTCRAQAQAFGPLLKRPEFNKLVVFKVNYDSQAQYWRRMGVRQQSTLIVYKRAKEVARSVGETDGEAIAELLRTATR